MVFKYIAMRDQGTKERGIVTCETQEDAEKILKDKQLTILKLSAVKSATSEATYFNVTERSASEKAMSRIFISSLQMEMALSQLGAMLEGGVPILTAFQTVAAQSSKLLSKALFCVANKLQSGKTLGETIKEELPFLGRIVTGLIAAGEANGDIDKMCLYSVELMERNRKLKGQFLQAMAYPVLVILVTIGIVTFLMTKVIPKIMNFLSSRSGSLPPLTQLLVDITAYLKVYGIYYLLAPIFIVIFIVLLRKNEQIAVHLDHFALRIPVIGKTLRASSNMLWCRTLGILIRSGINIIPALEFTEGALNNFFYKTEIKEMRNIIAQGHPLSTALRVSGISKFIPLADSMIVVGESTGKMDTGLMKVADFADNDLQRNIAFMTKMIEPALFVIVGGIVGFVYIAFFMGLMAASTGK